MTTKTDDYDEMVRKLREAEPHVSSNFKRGKAPTMVKPEDELDETSEIVRKLREANERMTKIKQAGAAGVLEPLRKEKPPPTRSTYKGKTPADAVPRFIESLLGEEGQERSRREEGTANRMELFKYSFSPEIIERMRSTFGVETAVAPGPGQVNTDIYAEYLPEHLQDDPDALAAAAEDAAAKNYDELLDEYGDEAIYSHDTAEIDGETWTKVIMQGGETFYTSPDGEHVLRDHDTRMPGGDDVAEMGSFPAVEPYERLRLSENLEEVLRDSGVRYGDEDDNL
jgi:hypothetical protein